jgi:hypothetical protein
MVGRSKMKKEKGRKGKRKGIWESGTVSAVNAVALSD